MTLAPWLALVLATPADGPDLAAIVAGLARTEEAIRDLSVATQYVKLETSGLEGEKPARMVFRTEFIVTSDGKTWYDCVGEQVNIGPDGMKTYPGHWRAADDGGTTWSMQGDVHGRWHSGSINGRLSWHGVNPLEYTTHYNRYPVSQILKERPPVFAGRAEWEGRPVVMVDTPATINGGAWKSRYWIDPERRIVVRRALMRQREPGKSPWYEYLRIESREHREIAPGIWLPMRFMYESISPSKGDRPEELHWRYDGTNSDWKVNQDPPASTFRLEFPSDVRINDHRPFPDAKK